MKEQPCRIKEGGGAHFGDDLWRCETCGREKYPEAFTCPNGVPQNELRATNITTTVGSE
jgi:hypothetical protein